MSAVDPVGPAPEAQRPGFVWLVFGCSVPPLFWAGQLILGYAVSAFACYPGDMPRMGPPVFLSSLLMVFDAVALAAALLGGVMSFSAWRQQVNAGIRTPNGSDGRIRLLALWGLMSSLGFLVAILFGSMASVMAPICGE
jgi:hypothetical protein